METLGLGNWTRIRAKSHVKFCYYLENVDVTGNGNFGAVWRGAWFGDNEFFSIMQRMSGSNINHSPHTSSKARSRSALSLIQIGRYYVKPQWYSSFQLVILGIKGQGNL